MHYKRHRQKKARAGCLLCKPHKCPGTDRYGELSITGFSTIRKRIHTANDLRKNNFDELIESVKEAGAIMRGEKKASRIFEAAGIPDVKKIRRHNKIKPA